MTQISIKREDLEKVKLFVGTPMFGGVASGNYTRAVADLSALCVHNKIQLQMYFLFNESLITRARNYISDEFMRSGATHLMWIDADIGFSANDILGLIALTLSDPKFEIVGAAYPKKCISFEKLVAAVNKGLAEPPHGTPQDLEKYIGDFVFNPIQGTEKIPINEPCEVLEIGTGFMMITRATMEKFKDHYWDKYRYRPDHVRTAHFDGSREIMQFFQAEIDRFNYEDEYKTLLKNVADGKISPEKINDKMNEFDEKAKSYSLRYLSEDYWFSQLAQKLGIRTWLCPWMVLSHLGSYVYGGSLADIAKAGVSPTADAGLLNQYKKR